MIKHYNSRIRNIIQKELFAARHTIKICMAWFTDDLLFQPLLLKLKTGVKVAIISNRDRTNCGNTNSVDFRLFEQCGGALYWNETNRLLHHKFCIIDGRVVISGSYNWTNKAEFNHEDITVYTDEYTTVARFETMFEKLLQEYSKSNGEKYISTKKQVKDRSNSLDNCSIIEYTSSDGKIIELNSDTGLDGVIVSNTYDKSKNRGIVKFDREITKIGSYTFAFCTNLTSIIIPNGVVEIGGWAFHSCKNLQRVAVPESILHIGELAFFRCESLAKFEGALVSEDERCIVINGKLVAFAHGNLKEYAIPDGVNIIGEWAFANCVHLKNITFSKSVKEIKELAFTGCTRLTNITLPDNITHIRYWAFSDCTSLTEITIPESLSIIDRGVFEYCESLTQFKGKYASEDGRCLIVNGTLKAFAPNGINEYIIPEGVNRIEHDAFKGCEKLSNITLAKTVASIGKYAFFNCKGLTSVVIPNGVVELEELAFHQCFNLSMISIPKSVNKLALSAFITYNKINIYINNEVPPIIMNDDDLFEEEEKLNFRFYVPLRAVSKYKNARGWSEYANQIFEFCF